MTEMPTHLLLPVDAAADLVRYLASRPYAEVAQRIATLQTLEPHFGEPENAFEVIEND